MAVDVTQLLIRWSDGDDTALDELTPIVYNELRKLARSYLQRRPEHAFLQPTMLVHEAWIKLAGKRDITFSSRSQFYGLASKIMREVLVDQCRRQNALKRGGDAISIALDENSAVDYSTNKTADLLMLDDALNRLAKIKTPVR